MKQDHIVLPLSSGVSEEVAKLCYYSQQTSTQQHFTWAIVLTHREELHGLPHALHNCHAPPNPQLPAACRDPYERMCQGCALVLQTFNLSEEDWHGFKSNRWPSHKRQLGFHAHCRWPLRTVENAVKKWVVDQ